MGKKDISSKSHTIGLVVFPLRNPEELAGQVYLAKFTNILSTLVKEVLVITGNYHPDSIPDNVKIATVRATIIKGYEESVISKARRLLRAQLALSLKLIQLGKKIDVVILLYMTGPIFLPALVARIQRKKVLLAMGGSFYRSSWVECRPPLAWFISAAMWLIEQSNYALANRITVGSDRLVKAWGINRNKAKVVSNTPFSYLDTQHFDIRQSLSQRGNIIGYVGRLYAEKGVRELARAIPLIISRKSDVKFLVVGDGPLKKEMTQELIRAGCLDRVEFTAWVPYREIPSYLNRMKIHVLPSHTEALGGTNLEAMACGAISIANSVGGLPDVVIEGETGFLLEDNSPQTIADKVIEVLNYPDLERIQQNARAFVEDNFSYDKSVERWRRILNNL